MKLMTIELEKMEFYAFHGHYHEEQLVGGRFEVSLSIAVDAERAAASDELADAVNYVELYACVRQEMEAPSHLLEHLAARISRALKQRFPTLVSLRLKVSKMAPALGGQLERVSLVLED